MTTVTPLTPEAQAAHDVLHDVLRCPNCGQYIKEHREDGCVLESFFSIIKDRGNYEPEVLHARWAKVDADAFWERLAPLLNDLEDGELP